MEEDLRAVREKLNTLYMEARELDILLKEKRATISQNKSYERMLLVHGKGYAEFSKLIYAKFSYLYSTYNSRDATYSEVIFLDLEANGSLEEVFQYRREEDLQDESAEYPTFCNCRLEDLIRFYGRSKLMGYNPSIVIADYYRYDLEYTSTSDTIFGRLGILIEDSAYATAFEYFATGAPFLEICASCSGWKPISESKDQKGHEFAANVLKAMWFEGEEEIICECQEEKIE